LRLAPRLLRRGQVHSSTPRLAQPDGDGLLGIPLAMLAFPDVLHLFAHEFPCLRGRRRLNNMPTCLWRGVVENVEED
jgi:hypothetical protein